MRNDGVAKMELATGRLAGRWTAPDGWWVVSEPTLVPKAGADDAGDGDAGYLLVFLSMARDDAAHEGRAEAEAGDGRASRLVVLDAATMEDAAVVALPGAVPYGLHSAWIPYEELS